MGFEDGMWWRGLIVGSGILRLEEKKLLLFIPWEHNLGTRGGGFYNRLLQCKGLVGSKIVEANEISSGH